MRKAALSYIALVWWMVSGVSAYAGDEVELVRYMSSLQYMAHKTGLSIDAKNQPLAGFYLHEIEEILEKLEEIDSFDGYAIGSLAKSTLAPTVERLEKALDGANWQASDRAFGELIESCNSCHQSTNHGYIRIQRREDNPYIQSFGKT